MTHLTHILCPVDFSDASKHALQHAVALARWYEARLTVVYVFENRPTMDMPPMVLEDQARARLIADLEHFTAHAPPHVPMAHRVEEAAFVHEAVLADIAALDIDLLVVGTHGRSGFQRLFFGSVTEKLLRKATCTTLVVPVRAPEIAPDAQVRFSRILCPVDFSEASIGALTEAITLAEEADAALTLLHVVELPSNFSESGIMPELDTRHMRTVMEADSRRRLESLVPEGARTYCTVETVVSNGNAYLEILREASARLSTVIVMSMHGRGFVNRLLLGSTTDRVLRGAQCPVLVVRGA